MKMSKNSIVGLALLVIAIWGISPVLGQYVLNTNSGLVHVQDCRTIKDSTAPHFVPVPSIAGYEVCKVCNARTGGIFTPPANRATPVQSTPANRVTAVSPSVTAGAWQPGNAQQVPAPTAVNRIPTQSIVQPTPPAPQPVLEWGWVRVQRVVDGDTFVLENGTRVRLIGVDTPETVHPTKPVEPFGKEASEYTKAFITLGENWVYLEQDGDAQDRYNRQLAMVYVMIPPHGNPENGKIYFLNDMLIKAGLGTAEPQYRYSQEMKDKFRQSEREARERRVGIWSLAL